MTGTVSITATMLGTFQQSTLRIEVDVSESRIRDSLLYPKQFRQWLGGQRFSTGLPEKLQPGTVFTSWIGPIAIHHHVEVAKPNALRTLLSQGIDGFHQWYWGEGWVQSCLEGVTILPINLGHTLSLLHLRHFLTH
jgi:hypothetical protein